MEKYQKTIESIVLMRLLEQFQSNYKKLYAALIFIVLIFCAPVFASMIAHENEYSKNLYPSTGIYPVGYRDYLWTNHALCPDPAAPKNKLGCRKIVIRIYYPAVGEKITSPYSTYVLNSLDNGLKTIKNKNIESPPNLSCNLNDIVMSADKDLKPIKRQFPAIIFSPGARDNLSEYTYSLINLASTGFIIVAINDTYLTDVKFPNNLVIPENQNITTNTLYRIKLLDIKFVYHQVLLQHKKHSDVFKYINPSKIGGLGHSAGGSAIIAMARQNPGTLKSAIALDAPNTTAWKNSPNLPKTFNVFRHFDIPFMQIHSSYAKDYLGAPKQQFNLSKNNFLVSIAPDK